MRKSSAIIVNPVSGKGNAFSKASRAKKILSQAGLEVSLHETKASGHGRMLAAEYSVNVDVLVSVGGDGTLNEVINGVLDSGSETPIAIIPAGTANVVSLDLGLPKKFYSLVKLAIESPIRRLDLGRAGDRIFIMCAGVGLDAAIVEKISLRRAHHGITMLSYVLPILKTVFKYSFTPMRVVVDGELVDEYSTFTVIGNMRHYGGPFGFFREATPDDGVLDICCLHGTKTIHLIRYMWGALKQNLHTFIDVTYYRGKNVTIVGDKRVLVQVDGDRGGHLPMTFTILPGAATFCVSYPSP
ncbi:MAG: diacylglycerol kinase family lipid kinase [Thermodesulfobacteriota bacterium]|nr:diacylglycerol kinase family lipid kinase [Thermodesulfobacteriota bacterium]